MKNGKLNKVYNNDNNNNGIQTIKEWKVRQLETDLGKGRNIKSHNKVNKLQSIVSSQVITV